jgi:5-hydroxyisourate hydrolase-like protein (transthyretin family)
VALVKAKNAEHKFAPAKDIKVDFYVEKDGQQQFLADAKTSVLGKAMIHLPEQLPMDTGRYFTVVAKIENNVLLEDADDQVHLKIANVQLKYDARDTSRTVKALVTEKNKDGQQIPVKDAEVKFYVKRLFGVLAASDDNAVATDENGEAIFSYPKTIPGDTAGVITLVARIEDNEQFGNVENSEVAAFGVPLLKEADPFPRALWSPYAPISMIITICVLFGGVWTTYMVILSMLRKIKKAGQV